MNAVVIINGVTTAFTYDDVGGGLGVAAVVPGHGSYLPVKVLRGSEQGWHAVLGPDGRLRALSVGQLTLGAVPVNPMDMVGSGTTSLKEGSRRKARRHPTRIFQ